VKDFRSLKVWQRTHQIVLAIYKITTRFPPEEVYALTNQIRRSAVSMTANIAEGCGKAGDAEFGRYLQIAMGSSSELEYELLLSRDLNYLDPQEYQQLQDQLIEIRKMLNALIWRLKAKR